MTRMIDADALIDRIEADKKQDNISPGNFFLFKAYIMNAPTIESDGDLISRADAIGAIKCDIVVTGKENAEIVAETLASFIDAIKSLPSAPYSRQRGEWVLKETEDGVHWWYECSECGEKPLFDRWTCDEKLSDFCPNCGADMRGEDE